MKENILKFFLFVAGILLANSCLDPYSSSSSGSVIGYLVVDGFLNATDSSCSVKVTNAIPLKNLNPPPSELNSIVFLEDDDGMLQSLQETNDGNYIGTHLILNADKLYRIRIMTDDKRQYISDRVAIVQTPLIDSISSGTDRTGVPIYINTHDSNNNTHYYLWKYEETWDYTAGYESDYLYVRNSVIPRLVSIYHCWKTVLSTSIIISSSTKLQQDIISNFVLTTIPWQSTKLKIKYSILVEQRGVTKNEYEYLEQVKKNTENLGTLFDPLPSTAVGNIHSITDPSKPAIGYFGAGTIQRKRVFISGNDIIRPSGVPSFITGYETCPLEPALFSRIYGELVYPYYVDGMIAGFYVSSIMCVDCRYGGGTIVKPSFWK